MLVQEGSELMRINTDQIVSITEANQNFSKVARMVDREGSVVIFKNNRPKYKLIDLEREAEPEITDEERIDLAAMKILKKYRKAFEVLAQ